MRRAWHLARHGARTFGGAVRTYIGEALRSAWREAKASARGIVEMQARVLATLEAIKAEARAKAARVAGPALDEITIARIKRESFAKVQAEAAAFASGLDRPYPRPAATELRRAA